MLVHLFESVDVNLLRNEDTLSLRHGLWLHDKVSSRIIKLERFEVVELVRKYPSLGEKFIVLAELLLHLI